MGERGIFSNEGKILLNQPCLLMKMNEYGRHIKLVMTKMLTGKSSEYQYSEFLFMSMMTKAEESSKESMFMLLVAVEPFLYWIYRSYPKIQKDHSKWHVLYFWNAHDFSYSNNSTRLILHLAFKQ